MSIQSIFARQAWVDNRWQPNVLVSWDAQGSITGVQTGVVQPPETSAVGWLLPGMPNLHSHAFQRIFSGLTEYRQHASDSFWSWRKLMYLFAQHITPEQLETIATQLYQEMLAAGYTSVCEFHYVHHQPGGATYPEAIAMSAALLRAAEKTGIGMTLLPVLYQSSGFGSQPAEPHQQRFIHDTAAFLRFWDQLYTLCRESGVKLGLAPHSLRAVPPQQLARVLSHVFAVDDSAPVHIHIAEQQQEVDDCLAWCGKRPVQWLLETLDVDARWCLIHATHMDDEEYRHVAQSGAVIGLCPTTEANLGDGIFDFRRWQSHQGCWGIGSDSHITVNAAEELQQLEYSQRLRYQQRNICCDSNEPDVAAFLYGQALRGGAQASGRAIDGIRPGQQADFIELKADHPMLAGMPARAVLAAHIFASSRQSAIQRVWTAGQLRHDASDTRSPDNSTNIAAIRQQIMNKIAQE